MPMDENHEPIAPLGTMFWFRPDALRLLFTKGWRFSDFSEEPNDNDGTILHAVERLYPFVAQDSGYYSMWCVSEDYAPRYVLNVYQAAQSSRRSFYEESFVHILLLRGKRRIKRILPRKLWKTLQRRFSHLNNRFFS